MIAIVMHPRPFMESGTVFCFENWGFSHVDIVGGRKSKPRLLSNSGFNLRLVIVRVSDVCYENSWGRVFEE